MDKNIHINKMADDVLNSMDHSNRATPQPFLLTKLHARLLNNSEVTMWDRISSVITRPSVSFAGLIFIITINILIILFNIEKEGNAGSNVGIITEEQDFSVAPTTALYDIENTSP